MSRSTAAHPEIKTAGASGAPISHIESICSIDNENVVIPIRSRLYYFEPVGIGTRDVECFTSYISRLGDAHCISVHSLVQHEILTQFDNVYRTEPRLLKSFWKASTAALNGTCSSTSNWVDALTELTQCQNLRFLTMLTWRHVLTTRMLVRRTQAWCPACYTEWRQEGRVLFQPLRWSLLPLTICGRHQCQLFTRCSNSTCGVPQPFLTAYTEIGYCYKCHQWLGGYVEGLIQPRTLISSEELTWQIWVEDAIGGLLGVAPEVLGPPALQRVGSSISKYANEVAGGSITQLSRLVGLSGRGLMDLQLGRRSLQIDTLLQICYRLGITPRQFLIENTDEAQATPLTESLPQFRRISHRTYKSFDHEGVEQKLQQIIDAEEVPAPSMAKVAQRIGHDQSHLVERFPALCRSISRRYFDFRTARRKAWLQGVAEEVRQVVMELHEKGIYPSHEQIKRRLTTPSAMRLPLARQARNAMLVELRAK